MRKMIAEGGKHRQRQAWDGLQLHSARSVLNKVPTSPEHQCPGREATGTGMLLVFRELKWRYIRNALCAMGLTHVFVSSSLVSTKFTEDSRSQISQ